MKILGKRWELLFCRVPPDKHGYCDGPHVKNKKIQIKQNMSDRLTLETILHESLHAASWHHGEEWVEEVSEDIARILWRLGYRRAHSSQENSSELKGSS